MLKSYRTLPRHDWLRLVLSYLADNEQSLLLKYGTQGLSRIYCGVWDDYKNYS